MTASVPTPAGYELRSELAQFCLPAAQKDRNQKLAWINSICLLYLTIGLVGVKSPPPIIREVAPLEQPVNIPVEAPPVQVTQIKTDEPQQEDNNSDTSDAPAIVAVTLNTPAVSFSVPTVGNVLVAASAAQAPPPKPMQTMQKVETKVVRINLTRGGNYPMPPYPQDAMRAGIETSIQFLISVDAGGTVTDVTVENMTGNQSLVNHTINHIKKKFTFPTTENAMQYRLSVLYPKMN